METIQLSELEPEQRVNLLRSFRSSQLQRTAEKLNVPISRYSQMPENLANHEHFCLQVKVILVTD